MKPLKTITDPENFQLLADETRRKIVFLLRAKEMTACQVAEELDLTPQAVYHHVRKLLSGGMIEVVREKRCGHLIESYYRATAETFQFSMGPMSVRSLRNQKLVKEQEVAVLEALKKIGFKLEYGEKQVAELVDLKTKIDEGAQCCQKYEDAVAGLEDIDLLGRLTTQEYLGLLSMSDQEYLKQQETKKKLRDLLISLIKK